MRQAVQVTRWVIKARPVKAPYSKEEGWRTIGVPVRSLVVAVLLALVVGAVGASVIRAAVRGPVQSEGRASVQGEASPVAGPPTAGTELHSLVSARWQEPEETPEATPTPVQPVAVPTVAPSVPARSPVRKAVKWHSGLASYYTEFGNRTACGQTMTSTLVGVASRTYKCGTAIVFHYGGQTKTFRVIDYGPAKWTGRQWDLTFAACVALQDFKAEKNCTGSLQWRLA